MFFRLFLLFTIIPIVELYFLIKIGELIGAFNTILIILITALLGAYLTKNQGFIVINRIKQAFRDGKTPKHELLHGLCILIGGFTLLTPGFLTDILGLSMLIPPTRNIYIRLIEQLIRNRLNTGKWFINNF
jgi:UPF0716 protein FxsA